MHAALQSLQIRPSASWRDRPALDCEDVIALVSREKHLSIRLLVHRTRGRKSIARARQLAMYLSHVMLGCSLAEIGQVFGRDRTTVSHACAVIEDLRDDRTFDEEVSALEEMIESALDAELSHAA
jgi:chromosomal replication initiation ATPase DnaA